MEAPPPTQRGHWWSASPSPSLLALSPFSSVPSHGYARKAGEVWRRRISCTVRRAKLTICLEGNQTNKVFQTIWNEKPDGTVQRDIKIQKGSTIRDLIDFNDVKPASFLRASPMRVSSP
uniref:Uncharacterized protein n=1 Tax=Oryza rufipogon TaxID=4529 RepID=A0A0E0QZ86_ORYRU